MLVRYGTEQFIYPDYIKLAPLFNIHEQIQLIFVIDINRIILFHIFFLFFFFFSQNRIWEFPPPLLLHHGLFRSAGLNSSTDERGGKPILRKPFTKKKKKANSHNACSLSILGKKWRQPTPHYITHHHPLPWHSASDLRMWSKIT